MASPSKREDLIQMLTQPAFLQKILSIAYKFIHDKTEAEDIVQDTIFDLLQQNTNEVRDVEPFIKKVVVTKAQVHFTKQANKKVILTNGYPEEPETADSLSMQMEITEITKAIKQHRDELDYTIFEMHACRGFDYEEIAQHTGETAGNLRHRMYNLRKWLKQNFRNER